MILLIKGYLKIDTNAFPRHRRDFPATFYHRGRYSAIVQPVWVQKHAKKPADEGENVCRPQRRGIQNRVFSSGYNRETGKKNRYMFGSDECSHSDEGESKKNTFSA